MNRSNDRKTGLIIGLALLWSGLTPGLFATTISIGRTGDPHLAERIVTAARGMLGIPYRWAGDSRRGVDCSGLVYYVFGQAAGRELPRGVSELQREGERVRGELLPGDLLFFNTMNRGTATHVGISLGGRQFIHSASEGRETGVIISSLEENYYKTRYLGARRLLAQVTLEIDIIIDGEAETTAFAALSRPELPVLVNIRSLLAETDYLRFSVDRPGRREISRHFREDPGSGAVRTSFVPETDSWTITISDDIKRELAVVSFAGKPGG